MTLRTDNNLRAGLYARVSTEDRGQDPETQLRPLREYAERRGFSVVGEFVDHASGTTEARPQYQRLLEAARKRELDVVLVWRYDRFARSTRALVNALTVVHVWTAPGAQGLRPDPASGTSAVMCPAFVAVDDRWPRWVPPNGPQTRMRLREAFAPSGVSRPSARPAAISCFCPYAPLQRTVRGPATAAGRPSRIWSKTPGTQVQHRLIEAAARRRNGGNTGFSRAPPSAVSPTFHNLPGVFDHVHGRQSGSRRPSTSKTSTRRCSWRPCRPRSIVSCR